MRQNVLLYTIIIYACMVSCTHNSVSRIDKFDMVETDSCVIPLDSLTIQQPAYIQKINDSVMCFYNRATHNICFVDLNIPAVSGKIQLYREGPDAVPWIDGFYYDADRIYLYESWGKRISIVDTEGKILKRIEIPETDSSGMSPKYAVNPFPTSLSPYIVTDGKHILSGMDGIAVDGQIEGATIVYDESNDCVITGNPFPAIYGSSDDLSNWDVNFRITSYAMMPGGDILICYPASDSLYRYHIATDTRQPVYAGYSLPTDINRGHFSSKEEKMVSTLRRYRYSGILYDDSKNVYYRMVALPLTNVNPDQIKEAMRKQRIAVIILDSSFNIVGETILPEGTYFTSYSFVNSDGLHINVESDDDDLMVYRVFKLAEK
ncbi:MAG: DUF4221 domain-containing protein [Clostridiales bacterium]|nr:DUF4221 domain-containing protein [Clostridiales bacterium]